MRISKHILAEGMSAKLNQKYFKLKGGTPLPTIEYVQESISEEFIKTVYFAIQHNLVQLNGISTDLRLL